MDLHPDDIATSPMPAAFTSGLGSVPLPLPLDMHDDTLGGIEGSPNFAGPSSHQQAAAAFRHERRHGQSHSFDQAVPPSPRQQQHFQTQQQQFDDFSADPTSRYNTPPIPPSFSRPDSGMSGAGDRQAPAQQGSTVQTSTLIYPVIN
jgi:hypothetical protein